MRARAQWFGNSSTARVAPQAMIEAGADPNAIATSIQLDPKNPETRGQNVSLVRVRACVRACVLIRECYEWFGRNTGSHLLHAKQRRGHPRVPARKGPSQSAPSTRGSERVEIYYACCCCCCCCFWMLQDHKLEDGRTALDVAVELGRKGCENLLK